MKALKLSLGILATIAFFWAVEHYWGWSRILDPFADVSTTTLLIAIVGLLSSYFIRALRLNSVLQIPNAKLGTSTRLIMLNNAFNILLPMRAGEASFPILLKRWYGVDIFAGVGLLLWLRLLDLWMLLVLGGIAATIAFAADWVPLALVGALIAMLAPLLLPTFRPLLERLGHKVAVIGKIVEALPSDYRTITQSIVWTALNWGIKILALGLLLAALAQVHLGSGMLGAIGGDLSSVLPIHAPGGLGTYELGVVGLLALDPASNERMLAAAVDLHLLLLCVALGGALLAWLLPKRVEPAATTE